MRACVRISQAIAERDKCGSERSAQHCESIFTISRFRLHDVRGNYFWPALHREVASRCTGPDHLASEQAFTRFARAQIDAVFPSELERLRSAGAGHCYLELIFSQAGIGKDRDQIIRAFLRFLAEAKTPRSGPPAERAQIGLNGFLASLDPGSRDDALPLRTVLLRIGREILSLVEALRQHADRGRLAFGGWKELRDLWLRISGNDIDTLTPSAGSAIHEFIPRLADTWTRAEIFRHTRAEGTECEWPDGTKASRCSSVRTMPLGAAYLRFRNACFPVTVIDRHDLQLERLTAASRGSWHSLDDGYTFRTSLHPFGLDEAAGDASVPVFVRDSGNADVAALHFWGGRLAPPSRVHRVQQSAPGRREHLHARVRWRWRDDEIFALIDQIHSHLPDGPNYRLTMGKQLLWEGSMCGGRPECRRPLSVKASELPPESAVEIRLESTADGGSSTMQLNAWPLTASHFLVANGRICDADRSIEMQAPRPETCDISLITRTPHEPLELTGLRELGRTNHSSPAAPLAKIALQLTGWDGYAHHASRRWHVAVSPAIALNYPTDSEVHKGGVSYTGAGNIHVSDSMDGVTLTTDNEPPQDGTFGFWIELGAETLFCPLSAQYVQLHGDGFLLRLGALARDRMPGQDWGLVSVTPGRPLSRNGLRYLFYVPPENSTSPAVALGERPRLLTNIPDSPIEFAEPVCERTVGSMGHGKLRGDGWELTARWVPCIFDLVIHGAPALADRRVLDVLKFDESQGVKATVLIPEGEEASIECGSTAMRVVSRQEVDLLPVIRGSLATHPNPELHLVGSGGRKVVWELEARPSVVGVAARIVSEAGGMKRIHVVLRGFAKQSQEILARLVAGTHALESRQFRVQPGPDFRWSKSLDLCTDKRAGGTSLALDLELDGAIVGPFEVAPAVGQSVPDPVRPQFLPTLKSLIADFRASNDPRYLVELFFAVFNESLIKGSVPAAAFRIAQNIGERSDRDPQHEQALVTAIECFGALFDGRCVSHVQVPSLGSEPIGMIRDSLWLLLAHGQAKKGELNPAQLTPKMASTATRLEHGDVRDARLRGLAEFAISSAAEALTRAGYPCPVSAPRLGEEARNIAAMFATLNLNS